MTLGCSRLNSVLPFLKSPFVRIWKVRLVVFGVRDMVCEYMALIMLSIKVLIRSSALSLQLNTLLRLILVGNSWRLCF